MKSLSFSGTLPSYLNHLKPVPLLSYDCWHRSSHLFSRTFSAFYLVLRGQSLRYSSSSCPHPHSFFFFFFFGLTLWDVGSYFPDQESNQSPLQWKHAALTTGPPGVLVSQSCLALCDFVDCSPARLLCLWNSPGKNTGVGSHSLLQGIFSTQGSNPGLMHCRLILYCLSHQEGPSGAPGKSPLFSPFIINLSLSESF